MVWSAKTKGFTLIELSIVIIVIGLLIAGITTGKSLIHAAQLNAVISESTDYQSAWLQFMSRYRAIPGDMPNATAFLGASTTNGNGNNKIDLWRVEGIAAWQHLSLANLISGTYTGQPDSNGDGGILFGINAPASKFGKGGYHFIGVDSDVSSTSLEIGAAKFGDRGVVILFTAEEAYLLDKKMDDGIADKGKVTANMAWSALSYTDTLNFNNFCTSGSDYRLADSGERCRLSIKLNNDF